MSLRNVLVVHAVTPEVVHSRIWCQSPQPLFHNSFTHQTGCTFDCVPGNPVLTVLYHHGWSMNLAYKQNHRGQWALCLSANISLPLSPIAFCPSALSKMSSSLSAQVMETILNAPAGSPPAGHKSNLVDPPSMATTGAICLILCTILPTLFVSVRLYTRVFVIRKVMLSECKSDTTALRKYQC